MSEHAARGGRHQSPAIGFTSEDIRIDQPTRSARLRWAIVVDAELDRGRAANAIACVTATTAATVSGLLGPDAPDAEGHVHPGLPWAGCTILAAGAEELLELRVKAAKRNDLLVVDMPNAAQTNRVYQEYLDEVAHTAGLDLRLLALSIFGSRNPVDRLIGKLALYR